MTTKLTTLVAIALALAFAVGPALAGKGGNGNGGNGGSGAGAAAPTSSISLDQTGQVLALGSTVTFTTNAVGLSGPEYALVYVECSSDANGSLVYGQLDLPTTAFLLGGGSSQWLLTKGPASCLAHLYSYGGKTIRELAPAIGFHANG